MTRALLCAAAILGLAGCSPVPNAATPTESAAATTAQVGGATGAPAPRAHCQAGDAGFLPDSICTTGATDPRVSQADISSTICRNGYTATVRPPASVTEPIKRDRMAAYGITAPLAQYELDHLVSGGGGDDDE